MSLKDSDVRTPGDQAIAKKFKLSLAKVRQLVAQGADHEKEHNTNLTKAKEVARDHIGERPDYYKMLNKAEKTDKNKLKEETGVTGTSGVRGLGYFSGEPGVRDGVTQYLNTNSMAYEDENGNKLEYLRKAHHDLHNKKLGFNAFDPTRIGAMKNFGKLNEDKDPCWKGYEMVGMKKKKGKSVPNCVPVEEDWQDVNRKDKTDGLSQKAVNAYRAENPGSKLQTAVTEKNPSGKRAKRRKSFCSRMSGMKKRLTSAKTARDPDSRINKALRRWNCHEETINETTFKKKVKYAVKAMHQQSRIAKELRPDQVEDDKVYKKRKKGLDRVFKESEQINEVGNTQKGREAIGKVNNRYLEKNQAAPSHVRKAVKKAWLNSDAGKIKDDTPFEGSHKRSHEKSSTHVHRLAVNAMKQYAKEETTMDTKEQISEAIANILENDLVTMKENFLSVLQEKAMESLEERKKDIAAQYFAQD